MKKTLKKPHLGQNFLHSEPVRRDIVNAAELTNEDVVLEIGPGKGFLTEILLSLAKKVIAVEKDRVLVKELKERFSSEIESKKLVLVEEDIRNFSPSSLKLKVGEYKLVANIPYYITGEIIRSFLDTKCHPSKMVLMVQKEVAQRISARDGKESILSIAVKAYGKPSIVRIVGRGSFTPVPKVDSAVIKIDNISKDFFKNFSEKEFFDMIHAGFAHKRKKLNSNLMEISSGKKVTDAFKKVELPENMRAEDLGLIQWQDLAKILAK
jgi:16S rRNA (adenine1518-N6/adenine1519-N6)-dimethyltransferase